MCVLCVGSTPQQSQWLLQWPCLRWYPIKKLHGCTDSQNLPQQTCLTFLHQETKRYDRVATQSGYMYITKCAPKHLTEGNPLQLLLCFHFKSGQHLSALNTMLDSSSASMYVVACIIIRLYILAHVGRQSLPYMYITGVAGHIPRGLHMH